MDTTPHWPSVASGCEPRAGLGEVSSRKLRDIAAGGGSEEAGDVRGHAAGAGQPEAGALRPGTHLVPRGQPLAALHVRGAGKKRVTSRNRASAVLWRPAAVSISTSGTWAM